MRPGPPPCWWTRRRWPRTFSSSAPGLAGEILEKFIQYRIKMAVYGDFSCYTSKPLRDFIYESNHGSDFFFVPEREEALRLLLRTAGRE